MWQFPFAHAGLLLRTFFGSEGQGQQQQDAPVETSPHDPAEGSQQPAPASAETEAAADQPAAGAQRHAEADFPDAAEGAAGEVGPSRGAQAGYGWPTTRPATHTGFATGTLEQQQRTKASCSSSVVCLPAAESDHDPGSCPSPHHKTIPAAETHIGAQDTCYTCLCTSVLQGSSVIWLALSVGHSEHARRVSGSCPPLPQRHAYHCCHKSSVPANRAKVDRVRWYKH